MHSRYVNACTLYLKLVSFKKFQSNSDKRAAVVVRLQGGLFRVIEILAEPQFDGNVKVVQVVFDLLALLAKRSTANTAIVAKMCGVPLVMDAAQRHLSHPKIFSSVLILLERMSQNSRVLPRLLEHRLVQWLFDSLVQYQSAQPTVQAVLRVLRLVVKTPTGATAFTERGGLEAMLPLVLPHLTKPLTMRAACSVLWSVQLHCLHDLADHERLYRLKHNYCPLVFDAGTCRVGGVRRYTSMLNA